MNTRWIRLALAASLAALAVALEPAAAAAEEPPSCTYTLALSALTGPIGSDLAIGISPQAAACAAVDSLKKVQVKTFDSGGKLADVRNLTDVAATAGRAVLDLGSAARGQRVEADVLVQPGASERTHVLRGETEVLLRPDLALTALQAPTQTLVTRTIDVVAEVAELNGDIAGAATVTLSWGPSVLATQTVSVPKGGRTSVTFAGIRLSSPVAVELTAALSDVAPKETDATNNARTTTVDVSEFELARSRVLVPSLGGYGAQFNQHVFARITNPPAATLPDLEAKVKAFEPQFVRIFYSEQAETQFPDRMASFLETVQLAHEAGATINITYQSAARAKLQPDLFMGQFAAILDDLVRARGLTGVAWVTVQNEPNTTLITPAEYQELYRALHKHLVARGLRDHIRIMGGDLVEAGRGGDHRLWFQYMADNMADILDAYSVHIYWNYWDTERMAFRLKDVRRIVTQELPEAARKPIYVTEFGVRGNPNFAGKPVLAPGYWQDGTQIARTNVAAFQQAWFNVLAAQLGFAGTAKWDMYWGKYDNGTQAHYMIGPASEGWPLFPTYHALRMFTTTTERGWQVVGVDPWNTDREDAAKPDGLERRIVAYAGPAGQLTVTALDTRGGQLNGTAGESAPYSIGGLPPHTAFNLVVWNRDGAGANEVGATVVTSGAGVARLDVPLHAAFVLTTAPVS
jgi:hypothetical protein